MSDVICGSPCALYRAWSRSGRLLYIGISSRPDRRERQHAAEKSWWTEVDRLDVEWHDTRHAAAAAERAAIGAEQPFYNLQRYDGTSASEYLKHRPSWDECRRHNIPFVRTTRWKKSGSVLAVLDTTIVPFDPQGPLHNRWESTDPDGVLTLLLGTATARALAAHDWTIAYGATGSTACISRCLSDDADPISDALVDWWSGGTLALELLEQWDA